MQEPYIRSTQGQGKAHGIKACVYGKAGMGKTFLATTCEAPMVIMTEPGLLSLRRYNIPFIEARTVSDLHKVADWMAGSREARKFNTFFLDSLSETVEIVLAAERLRVGMKEPRKAYNELLIISLDLIRRFRDLVGPNVIFTAKQEYSQDDTGAIMYRPKFPGQQLGIDAPYFFDELWQLHLHTHANGVTERAFRCHPTNQFEAKDRSGSLDPVEQANLTYIFNKINGV